MAIIMSGNNVYRNIMSISIMAKYRNGIMSISIIMAQWRININGISSINGVINNINNENNQ
jgi:hypothetical protein